MGPNKEMSTSRSRSPTSRSTTPPSCEDVTGKFSVLDELRLDALWPDDNKSCNFPGNTNASGDREIHTADFKINLFLKRFYERDRELGITTDGNNNQILPPIVLDFVLRYSISSTFTPSFADGPTKSKKPSVAADGGALQQLQLFASASSDSTERSKSSMPQPSAASPDVQLQPPDSPRPTSTSPDYRVPLRRPPPTAGYRAKKERYRPPVQNLRQPSFLPQSAAARKEAFKYRGTYSQRKPDHPEPTIKVPQQPPLQRKALPGVALNDNSDHSELLKNPQPPPLLQDQRLPQNPTPSQSILKFPQNHYHDPRRVLPVFCLPLQPCPQQAFQPVPRGRPRVRTPKDTGAPPVDRTRKRPQKKSVSDTWNRKVQKTMDASFPQSFEKEDCMIIGEVRKGSSRS